MDNVLYCMIVNGDSHDTKVAIWLMRLFILVLATDGVANCMIDLRYYD